MRKKAPSSYSRNPDVKKLVNDPEYRLVLELDFNEMIPFVLTNIKRKGVISFLYLFVNIGLLIALITMIIVGLIESHITWLTVIKQAMTGVFIGSIFIILPHELLHGAAYYMLGARKIRFGADLRQLIFYVTADQYTVSGRALGFLALTPFIVINTLTIAIFVFFFPGIVILPSFLLLSHNIMCIGDFAIVNYVMLAPQQIFSYDDPRGLKSYFYQKVT